MKRLGYSLSYLLGFSCVAVGSLLGAHALRVHAEIATSETSGEKQLPTTKNISVPAPGNAVKLNGFPAAIAVSPDGRYAVTLNQGYGTHESNLAQSLSVMDLKTGRVEDFPDSRLSQAGHQSYFLGLQFSKDGRRLFASFGSITDPTGATPPDTGNGIAVYSFDGGKIVPAGFWKIPLQPVRAGKIAAAIDEKVPAGRQIPYPAGFADFMQDGRERLLVADNLSDNALVLDATNGNFLQRFDLSTDKVVPGSYPRNVVVSRDGKRAWVSLWNASRIAELDLGSGRVARMISVRKPDSEIAAGSHPAEMVLSADGSRLFVALANADEIADIQTKAGTVSRYYPTAFPNDGYVGAQPIAIALDSASNRLYVADAGLNAIAVVDVQSPGAGNSSATAVLHPTGFIPTDWYPSAVAVVNGELLIASAKGEGTVPNPPPNSGVRVAGQRKKFPYIMELIHGSLARISLQDVARNLESWTQQVRENAKVKEQAGQIAFAGGKNPIHHVIYIIRENRTYDQMLGDIAGANGDASLTMYGEEITPNAHALARSFGILDNFYASGEVSGNGHNWSTAAAASDYLELTLPIAYRGEGERLYDYEGEVANRVPLDDDMSDVNETGTGYIWTDAAKHGLTYRHYGEFVATRWCNGTAPNQMATNGMSEETDSACVRREVRHGEALPANLGEPRGSASPWPWAVPMIARNVATKPELRGHFDPLAADFNVLYPDQFRVDEFLNEFSGFVKARESGSGTQLPNYVLLRLGNDHTQGTRPNGPTPAAAVADNDLAIGRVVDAVSHSAYWDDTAILIVEDDAQDGPDHVDAHRTVALVISKYSPSRAEKPYVEKNFLTTVNLVRTLEALLGLPPMNTNDGHATAIASLFSGDGTHPPYTADDRNLKNGLIYQMNSLTAYGASASAAMDFSAADRANNVALNEILWHDRMGSVSMPAPQHNVFSAFERKNDENDSGTR